MRFGPATAVRFPGTLILMLAIGWAVTPASRAEEEEQPPPCSSPGARQFDFWLGKWEASWEGGRGTNRIDKILDGCVIHENFDGGGPRGNGLVGKSHSTYAPELKRWRQTWVDNQAGYLDFVGGMQGDRMILSRTEKRDGETFLQRMVWHDIKQGSFAWNWERSDDGGKSWRPVWVIHYVRVP